MTDTSKQERTADAPSPLLLLLQLLAPLVAVPCILIRSTWVPVLAAICWRGREREREREMQRALAMIPNAILRYLTARDDTT
jgi:hypothetical protein